MVLTLIKAVYRLAISMWPLVIFTWLILANKGFMDKKSEILAVSRAVLELTRIGDDDLDRMLEHLCQLLPGLPGMCVQNRAVLLLPNIDGVLTQVAQHGLLPVWLQPQGEPEKAEPLRRATVLTLSESRPVLHFAELDDASRCFALPVWQGGRLLLFIAPDWQPDAVDHEFMDDLARALSVIVLRTLANEALRVREIELEEARTDAIRRLGAASEYRDNETGMHVMRMSHFASSIAKALGLPPEQRELLAICAPMHDVGKIGIPDAILLKPGKLSEDEFRIMQTHTDIGSRLLTGDDSLILAAREIAESHHERWDGSGYPHGLAGERIPLLARICAVSDVFDALTSSRPYKQPWPVSDAVAWIRQQSGSHFDPAVVAAFDRALPEILRIRELYRDDIIDPNQSLLLPEIALHDSQWVCWDESYNIGIDVIDAHHHYLFDLTNDLFEVVSQKHGGREVMRVLRALDQYAQVHFRAEERMMAHWGYTGLELQQSQHAEFENRLRAFYEAMHVNPLTTQFDVLVYLRQWLVFHIVHEDGRLRSQLRRDRQET